MDHKTGTGKYEQLLERCAALEPVPTAVVHPCEITALTGALDAGLKGLIIPILVGPVKKISEVAKSGNLKLDNIQIIDTAHSHESAEKAVALVREGKAELLMKG